MERTISFMNGKGSIGHNTRSFIADNVDASRTKNNITLIHEDIKQVYHKLFDKALDEYNAKQKRKDRQIKSYYEKISRSKQEKLFYEVIVQIGNKDETGVGSSAAEVATWVLKDYVKMFQLRNPQLYVIGAYIHLDEETPHLHLNFVPWVSGCKRGLETKTSLKAELATRGFASEGKGNTEWKQWAEAEKDDIALIMRRYGIDWKKKNTHNLHLSVLDYKKQERAKEVAALEEEIEGAQVVLELKEERLESLEKEIENKDAKYTSDIAINILKLLKYVLGNNSDIMERELSVAVLGDTKLFEKSYKSRICSIIEEYGELELDLSVLDKKEKEKAILEEYQVFSNPSYIFFKGNVDIHYVDGNSISVTPDNPIAILSEAIARIEMIKVNSNRIVTVENLTSYNRINDNKSTFIYLSGYHNTAKQRFLKKIAENNSGVSWFHFGDIDPDGYYILKNLVEKTGIAFVPLYMDVQQLINCKQYCKPLEKNDMVKANSLLKFHFYDEVMEFMLANNCKLEQEIISWLYERD